MQMRNSLVLAAVAFFAPALAQAASPQAEKNMSMGLAQEIVAGVIEECAKNSYKVSVVVVDKAGQVSAALRGDGTSPATVDFARMKAYTARVRNQTSLEFMNLTATGDAQALRQIPGVVAIGGGVPIKAGNEVIGALGVGGAPAGNLDEQCALVALDKVKEALN